MPRLETTEFLSFYRSTAGRRAFACSQVAAAAADYPEIASLAATARAHDEAVVAKQHAWLRAREDASGAAASAEAVAAERACDRLVGSFYRVLVELATLSGPRGAAAKRLLDASFPAGAEAITNLSYAEAATTLGVMLRDLSGAAARLGADVEAAGVGDYVAELSTAFTTFDAAVRKQNGARTMSWDEVRADDRRGQVLYADLIVAILYHTRGAERAADRARLLHPLEVQNEALRELYRSRRTVTDVDPTTGVVVPDTPGPTPA